MVDVWTGVIADYYPGGGHVIGDEDFVSRAEYMLDHCQHRYLSCLFSLAHRLALRLHCELQRVRPTVHTQREFIPGYSGCRCQGWLRLQWGAPVVRDDTGGRHYHDFHDVELVVGLHLGRAQIGGQTEPAVVYNARRSRLGLTLYDYWRPFSFPPRWRAIVF